MKRIFSVLAACGLCAALLASCAGGSSSSASSPASSSAASSSLPAVSSAAASSAPAVSPTGADLSALLTSLSEAAALGDTIEVSEIDLKAAGLDTANVISFAGAESRLSSENGGIVMLFQMQPGNADAMVTALEAYRDARAGDDRYAEFATARENTAAALITAKGDLVIYAVSASGQSGLDALNTAVSGIA